MRETAGISHHLLPLPPATHQHQHHHHHHHHHHTPSQEEEEEEEDLCVSMVISSFARFSLETHRARMMSMNSKQTHFGMHPSLPEHKYTTLHSSSEAIRRACLQTPQVRGAPSPHDGDPEPTLSRASLFLCASFRARKSGGGGAARSEAPRRAFMFSS